VINKAAIRVSGCGSLCCASQLLKQVGLGNVGASVNSQQKAIWIGKRKGDIAWGFPVVCWKVSRTSCNCCGWRFEGVRHVQVISCDRNHVMQHTDLID
jgi:hypothetical protein